MIQFRSNIQTAEFGLYQIYKQSDINLLRALYILLTGLKRISAGHGNPTHIREIVQRIERKAPGVQSDQREIMETSRKRVL